MAQGMFVANVIDDGMAYGKDISSRLSSITSLLLLNGVPVVILHCQQLLVLLLLYYLI